MRIKDEFSALDTTVKRESRNVTPACSPAVIRSTPIRKDPTLDMVDQDGIL
jgi:hypothetical protein